MHTSAFKNVKKFYKKYLKDNLKNKKVLDIGSYDVNGSVKPIFAEAQYLGLDMQAGPNVDMICNSHNINLPDESFDVILSTSCFEHDEMFWVTFLEICRLVKPQGYIYINKPSAGEYHPRPTDCWRFYQGSGQALTNWAKRNNYNISLLENYIDYENKDQWKDCVNIWQKI